MENHLESINNLFKIIYKFFRGCVFSCQKFANTVEDLVSKKRTPRPELETARPAGLESQSRNWKPILVATRCHFRCDKGSEEATKAQTSRARPPRGARTIRAVTPAVPLMPWLAGNGRSLGLGGLLGRRTLLGCLGPEKRCGAPQAFKHDTAMKPQWSMSTIVHIAHQSIESDKRRSANFLHWSPEG